MLFVGGPHAHCVQSGPIASFLMTLVAIKAPLSERDVIVPLHCVKKIYCRRPEQKRFHSKCDWCPQHSGNTLKFSQPFFLGGEKRTNLAFE